MRAMAFERLVHDRGVRLRAAHQERSASWSCPARRPCAVRSRNESVDGDGEASSAQRPPQGDLRRRGNDDLGPRDPLPLPRGRGRQPTCCPTSRSSRPRGDGEQGRRLVAGHGRRQGLRARAGPHRRRAHAQGVPPGRPRRRVGGRVERLPKGMEVHRCGALAVPRNAYLRPEAVGRGPRRPPTRGARPRCRSGSRRSAKLGDDRSDRRGAARATSPTSRRPSTPRPAPRAASSATAAASCGPRPTRRPCWSRSACARLAAGASWGSSTARTEHRRPRPRRRWSPRSRPRSRAAAVDRARRVDPVGLPGSDLRRRWSKSDAAALGVHGIAVQRVGRVRRGAVAAPCLRAHQRDRDPARR